MIDVQAIRSSTDLVAVIGSRIQLTTRGHEHVGLCPFHADTHPSLFVTTKGFAHCFSCGWNGDAIAFLQDHDGLSFREACETLQGRRYTPLPMKPGLAPRPAPRKPWKTAVPPPACSSPASFATPGLGEPVSTWCYRTSVGEPWGYVTRYDVSAEGETRKLFLQWTWGRDDTATEAWGCRHFSAPRPLYNLPVLSQRPTAQVIVVEGEKTADAASVLFPTSCVVTWPGGSHAADKTDWTPLYGRAVIVIPDADDPGRKACSKICAILSANGCTVRWIDPEPTRPRGWDLADALADHWVHSVAVSWAKEHIKTYTPDAQVALQTTHKDKGDPTMPRAPKTPRKAKLALVPPQEAMPPQPPDDVPAPLPPAFSDDALAARMVSLYQLDWRYLPKRDLWYRWNGCYWTEEELPTIWNLAKLMCREVVNFEQGALLSEAAKRAICSKKTHAAVVTVATYDPILMTREDQWDADAWALCTPGGVIDLKTGEVRPNRREEYLSQSTTIAPSGDCPRWRLFMQEVTAGDRELEAYLQRLAGYCLTGVQTEQMFAFFYGTGGNGKSVFLHTLRDVLGDYTKNAQMETFTESQTERHTTELARLRKARLVISQESEGNKKLAESKIKMMTGGDKLTCRFMRQDDFEFQPHFKIILAGNHKPGLHHVDEAMRRRIHIVPFTVTIPPEQRDHQLEDKLKTELPGILAWAVEGCLAWQRTGLAPPLAVTRATDDYMEGEDQLAGWLGECVTMDPSATTACGLLYTNYVAYCEANKDHAWSKVRLMKTLYGRGYAGVREFGIRSVHGLLLKDGY